MGFISEIIGWPLGWIMWFFYQIFQNYALAIIFFTIITKLLLIPFSIKQQKSTAAMQAIQPKLDKLKKKYGNNQEKLSEETMKLYNEEGVNPMASCLPMFIQFPILYGILDVVYRPIYHMFRVGNDVVLELGTIVAKIPEYTELIFQKGNTSKVGWRGELYIIEAIQKGLCPEIQTSHPEIYDQIMNFNNKLFGADMSVTPTLKPEVWDAQAVILLMIPILSGVFQLIYTLYSQKRQKKNASPETAAAMSSMNLMFYIMPIFSVWLAFTFPAALGFYWMISAIITLIQQIILNKIITPEYIAKLVEKDKIKKKNSKTRGLMERYQQMYEEQMAAQNGGKVSLVNKEEFEKSRTATAGVVDEDEDDGSKEIKLSKSKQKEYERMLIREARRRQAEKYGDEYIDDDEV